MDVSRGTLIVGGTFGDRRRRGRTAIAGLRHRRPPWSDSVHRADRSGAPPVNGLHLQYGSDAASEVVVSWHTAACV